MARKSADAAVRDQYAALPYPRRDPRDEARRLVVGSPSRLAELNHYVFAGRMDWARPLRVLVAGGGTGDATVMLAQQTADAGCPADIVHLEPSDASRAVAEARIQARGLDGVRFVKMSLLDLPGAGLGPFDYVDCCGVLHHLDDPAAGLRALASVLADGGGMGLMLYGELGRTGVYPVQELLRSIGRDEERPERRIATAKALLKSLPPTNWLRRNPFLADHLEGGDEGLFDLLLHARDRAYRVGEIAALADSAGLAITSFIDPAVYDPASYVADAGLAERFAGLSAIERWGAAERIVGSLRKHVFYVVAKARAGDAVAQPGMTAIPVWRSPEDAEAARRVQPGTALLATLHGVRFRFAVPPLVAAIAARIDGNRDLRGIHADLRRANPGLDEAAFRAQFELFYTGFNGLGFVFLRTPSCGSSAGSPTAPG